MAYFHHQHNSSGAPKGHIFNQLLKNKQEDNINCRITGSLNTSECYLNESDFDKEKKSVPSFPQNVVCEHKKHFAHILRRKRCDTGIVMTKDDDKPRTWKDIAHMVNKTLMISCLFMTVMSMVVTSALILALR